MTLRADIKFQIINNGCYSQITILPLEKKKVPSHENLLWEKNFNGTSIFKSLMQAINITNIHVIPCSKCRFQMKSIINKYIISKQTTFTIDKGTGKL